MTESGTFRNAAGGRSFYQVWKRKGGARPRGSLLLVHGLGEHTGRYAHVAEHLAERGVEVYAYDHQGHGRTEGRRGWIAAYGHFLDDLHSFHRFVREQSEGPLVLLGHSMGGLIVATYLLERPLQPEFLVLSGPAIVPLLDPADRTIDPTRLSRDPAVWEAYLTDPYILRERVEPELFVRLAEGLALLPGRAGEISVPCLLIHGEDDRLCSAEGAKMYVEGFSSPDVTVRLYPGGRHEMFNEVNRNEVLDDLWSWIDVRVA